MAYLVIDYSPNTNIFRYINYISNIALFNLDEVIYEGLDLKDEDQYEEEN